MKEDNYYLELETYPEPFKKNIEMIFTDYFDLKYKSIICSDVSIRYRDSSAGFDNNLGNLSGIDLDSAEYTGYIYFWDNGFFDFGVFNLKTNEEQVPSTVIETDNFINPDVIKQVIKFLSK